MWLPRPNETPQQKVLKNRTCILIHLSCKPYKNTHKCFIASSVKSKVSAIVECHLHILAHKEPLYPIENYNTLHLTIYVYVKTF